MFDLFTLKWQKWAYIEVTTAEKKKGRSVSLATWLAHVFCSYSKI